MEYSPRIREELRSIRVALRRSMNGVVVAGMRERGLAYRLNFGVTLPLLKRIAAARTPDSELAEALWAEDVRECKILATLLYPPARFSQEKAEAWIGAEVPDEIRDQWCANLLAGCPFAAELGLRWLSSGEYARQYAGGQLWAVLFRQKREIASNLTEAFPMAVKPLLSRQSSPLQPVLLNALRRAVAASPETAGRVMAAFSDWAETSDDYRRAVYNDLSDTGLSVGTLFA